MTRKGVRIGMYRSALVRTEAGAKGGWHPGFRLFWIMVGCVLAASGGATEVAIVKTVDILPYQQAVAGFKEKFNGQITEYVLTSGESVERALQDGIRQKRIGGIMSLGTDALALTRRYAGTVPVVYGFVLDPGPLLASMPAAERARIAGLSMSIPAQVQLATLLRIRPGTRRVGVVYDPARSRALVDETRSAVRALGMTLVERPVKSVAESIDAYTALFGESEVILMMPDATAISAESLQFLMLFSLRNNIPVIGIADKYVKMGALFALSFDTRDIGRQTAELANRLLENASTAPLTPVPPRKFAMSINLKSAASLGLSVPQELVDTATTVYR